MIKNILWDFDGVMIPPGQYYYDKISSSGKYTAEEFRKILPWSEWSKMMSHGVDIIPNIVTWLPKITKEDTDKILEASNRMERDHVEMFVRLSEKYNSYSATNRESRTTLDLVYRNEIQDYFKGVKYYCAGTIGCLKPDVKFLQTIVNDENLKPEETIFIDDLEENIELALDMGMHAVHYVYKEKDLEAEIEKIVKSVS